MRGSARSTRARARHHQPLSCVMMDFDDFKAINDTIDHCFGDFVLRAFASKVRIMTRNIDIAARIGGDEFALLLPNTGLDEAVVIAERIRSVVDDVPFEQNGHSARITLSIGIASYDGVEPSTPEEFLRRADCSLLEAKRRGKGRTILYPQIAHAGLSSAPDS
jgi:diguanylate cyclase (GGDEF)-like protein